MSFEQLKAYYKDKDWMVERIENLEFDLTAVSRMSPLAAVNYIRKSIGYDAWLYEYAAAHHVKAEELLETAEQLRESAARYKTFDAWFEHIRAYGEELKRQAREREEQADAVMLSTMHSSKGWNTGWCTFWTPTKASHLTIRRCWTLTSRRRDACSMWP